MILTGENISTSGRTHPSATLCTKNFTRNDLGSNLGLCSDRQPKNRLNHSMATSSESRNAHICSKEIPCHTYVYTYTYIYFSYYTKIYNQLFILLWFTHMYIVTCSHHSLWICLSQLSLELGHLQCLGMNDVNKEHCI